MGDHVSIPLESLIDRNYDEGFLGQYAYTKRDRFSDRSDQHWYPGVKQGFFRLPFSMSIFDWDSIHLMTRHAHKKSTAGFIAPLAMTCWFYLVTTLVFIQLIMHTWKENEYFTVLNAITIFVFSLFYNQDLRSSTIEPRFEKFPDHIDEVDTRIQHVMTSGPMAFQQSIIYWNLYILNSHDISDDEICHKVIKCSLAQVALRRMAKSPNYFVLTEKERYHRIFLDSYNFI